MPEDKNIRVATQVLERLKSFPIREKLSEDDPEDSKEPLMFVGALYGIDIEDISEEAVIVSVTGRPIPLKDKDGEKSHLVEFLSDVFPCGINPVGVVFMSEVADDAAGEDFDFISKLIGQLPDTLLDVSDPIIITRHGNHLRAYTHTNGGLHDANIVPIEMSDVDQAVTVIRLKGKVTLTCCQSENELGNVFKYLLEKVSSPYGAFQLENSDVHFLHTFAPKHKPGSGWTSKEMFQEAYEEECLVTNLRPLVPDIDDDEFNMVKVSQEKTVDDLWQLMQNEVEEEDDGFGVPGGKKKPKAPKKVEKSDTMNFQLLLKMSGDACTTKTLNCAPIVHYEKKSLKNVRIPLTLDSLGVVSNTTKIYDLMEVLKGCAQRQIQELAQTVLSEFRMRSTVNLPQAFHLKPKPLGHFVTIVYTKALNCGSFAQFRRHLHKTFLLPCDQPYFRRMNKFIFEEDKRIRGPLINVHVGLKSPGANYVIGLVHGNYAYHHYLQDKFDDDGWGCAYRSLQTIISWFRFQGYIATEVPTHSQIQKCLVDIGDKESKFIGSKQWIGSTEVGFVLETSCSVQSRFMSVNSGAELATKGRELLTHFKTNGTPIMIGGGVLAHTILGVAVDEENDDIRYLVLDPHFTGSDWNDDKPNLNQIQSKGWVGWKGPEFWKKDAFYNLCMPQKPAMW